MRLTELEIDIIDILAHDARRTAAEIAVMTGEPEDKVAEIIKRLEQARVIVGYPALINWDKTQKELVQAIIEVRVSPVKGFGFDAIAGRILSFDEVESLYLMSGAYDLMLELSSASLKELALFVAEKLAPMENVLSTATHFVLKKYKSQGITMEKKADNRQAVSQ